MIPMIEIFGGDERIFRASDARELMTSAIQNKAVEVLTCPDGVFERIKSAASEMEYEIVVDNKLLGFKISSYVGEAAKRFLFSNCGYSVIAVDDSGKEYRISWTEEEEE